MNRFSVATALVVMCAGGVGLAQRNFDSVQIKTTRVAGDIYMLTGSGGNIGVSAGEDGLIIIDDQYAPLAAKIKKALSEIKKGDPVFVLNTHYHGDHVGGNLTFGRTGTIIAHTNVRKRLETGGSRSGPMAKGGLPIITFDESLTIHFNGEDIRAMHFAHGHTDGDSVIFFPRSNVVHMGDHFFNGIFPFVDLEAGGTVQGYTRNVKAVIDQVPANVKIIPGHGALATLTDLRKFHAMLTETTEVVRGGMGDGKTVDELKKAGFPARFKTWAGGFISTDRWIETIHASLSRN